MTSLVVPEMMKLCFLQADPLLNVRWFGLTLRGVLTCASVGHHAGESLKMARDKDEDHIVFTSSLFKRNPVGAGALSSRALPCIALSASAG